MEEKKDTISRQAAIDAMAELQGRTSTKAELKGISKAWKRIKQLPPAQPEIVRCKDCKHKVIENDIWTCPFGLPGGPEFFCGYGKRRGDD